MKKYLLTLGLSLLLGAMAMPMTAQVSNDNEDGANRVDQSARANDFVPGQVLVKFKDESSIQVQRTSKGKFRAASINKVDQLLHIYGVRDMEKLFPTEVAKPKSRLRKKAAPNGTIVEEKNLDKVYWIKTNVERPDSTLKLIEELKALPEVEYAEPNYKVYITADVPSGYGTTSTAQTQSVRRGPVAIETTASVICSNPSSNPLYFRQYGITQQKIQKLWNKPIINNRRPVIAILDTGVDITHPDLEDNIWTNTQEVEGERAYDDDNNSIVDDVHGWNFVNNNYDLTDRNGHGTHVAGIAAAADNNIGIVGANPLALIMPVKVMNDRGEGDQATIARGIDYAFQNGADIINMSLGSPTLGSYMKDAIDNAYQTAIIVASAGNYGVDIYTNLPGCYGTLFPAAYYIVLGVEASASNLQRAGFSNYDPDGPIFSEDGIDGRNYEVQVPGDKIYSTLPGGMYNQLSGTSMSSPLLAGAISALLMVKDYPSKDVLYGDLIHLKANFEDIYSDDTPRKPKIVLVSLTVDDNVEGNTNIDGQVDVGETIKFTPVLRNTWADATDINLRLSVDNNYQDFVTIQNPEVPFGYSISAYGREKAQTPITVVFGDNIGDNTRIKFTLEVSYSGSSESISQDVYVTVNNMVKIGGFVNENMTLSPNHQWLVTKNLSVPEGVILTILPGTVVSFENGTTINCEGELIANGTVEKKIVLKSYHPEESNGKWKLFKANDEISYCLISDCRISNYENGWKSCPVSNCELRNVEGQYGFAYDAIVSINNSNIIESEIGNSTSSSVMISSSNIVNNIRKSWPLSWDCVKESNVFNCNDKLIGDESKNNVVLINNDKPPYLGTSIEELARLNIIVDANNSDKTFAYVDLSNMPTHPYPEAHGIVWKVVVNGYDAHDEYEQLPPLGVAKHKFEVYFNRPMNKAVTPKISFGVREPYTQHAVDEEGDGSGWNEEGTIYTVYKTINGRTQSDGINRIYVRGAEDNEYFACPYEKTRFNINIQTAGALATGFAAEEKMGRVELTWTSKGNDFSDAMGFNIYRYTMEGENQTEPVRLNDEVILVKEVVTEDVNSPEAQNYDFTDYNVTPGETYYYYYKVLSTDLQEYDVSNVVAATPLTTVNGDADGSGDVKVGDVISTVNYILGENPKPFIFEAADVNTDQNVDVLDVIGIIQLILNQPSGSRFSIESMAQAVYTVEDGVLYLETPVTLAGVQAQLSLNEKGKMSNENLAAAKNLKGFEIASTWLTENDYRMLAYSFGSKVLMPGKHAIMTIGDADITSLRLSDTQGNAVLAVPGDATLINDTMGSKVLNTKGVWNLSGQKVSGNDTNLRKGVYIIDGQKIVK